MTAVFFVNGAVLANWVPRIPDIKDRLGLGEGALGLALLGVAAGALLAMPLAGRALGRVGAYRLLAPALLLYCVTLPLLALAPDLTSLTAALFVIGAANGTLDVAMNHEGVGIEREHDRAILASFHGAFSVGGLAGAVCGGAFAVAGVAPLVHFAASAAALGCIAAVALVHLRPAGALSGAPAEGPILARPPRKLLALGLVAFCCLLAEGSVADWSAVYMRGALEAGPVLSSAAFAAFSLTMAIGRLTGDRLTERFGPVVSTRTGGAAASVGLAMVLATDVPIAAVIGFACVGAGLATVLPTVLRAAASTPGVAPATGIAATSTVGYLGFLAGPPAIGFVAEAASLRGALWIVVAGSAVIALLAASTAPVAARRTGPPRRDQCTQPFAPSED
jgi:MFS family permease